MDRFRRQRSEAARFSSASRVTTIIDRSSDDKLVYNDRPLRGNHHALKQKLQRLESDSGSRGRDRTTLEHQLAAELGRTSSVSPAGSLMKSLLEDEMLKETESRRRAPSVIAKLMGLDRMPSQNGSGKQPKRPSESLHRQSVSAGACRHRKSCKNQSCRKIAREQQQFKDVYEVRESLKGQAEAYSPQLPLSRKHTQDEIDFVRQKFMDAKRLSTDEKLQDSKEFHDAIDVLNSNNHLFLKLLQEPDSLFAKRQHDMHAPPQPHSGNVRKMKVSKILDYNINAIGCQAGREGSQKIDISFSRHCQESALGHMPHRHAHDSDKYATFPAEGKEVTRDGPTKIVLLKPNLGRSQKTAKSFSSSSPCELWPEVEMHSRKQTHDRHGDAELWGKQRLPTDPNFFANKSRNSREIAKEITQEMKTRLSGFSFDVPLSGYKGYSADESSHDMSGNDSSNESDATYLTYQTPSSSSFRGNSSSSRFGESSVNREGKKRLSERWKMTHRSQEIRMEKGTTLGEMLSMPDWDIESPNLDGAVTEEGSSGRSDGNVRLAVPAEPLGISSKDGWNDGRIRNLSRCRSLPSAYDHVENSESHIKHELFGTKGFLVPKEGARHGRNKAVNRDLRLIEGSSYESRRLSDKKPRSSHRMSKEMENVEQEDQVGVSGNISVHEEKDAPENKTVTLEAPTCRLDRILNLDATEEIEHENIHVSLNSGDDLLPAADLSADLQAKDYSSSSLLHESTPQNPAAQPKSPASSKEADQPSPVSVLEAPFAEDPSSGSECFERVSADLHGLRMQLQLLKLESNSYDEGSSLISSDEEEASTGSVLAENGPRLTESDSWEVSYTADVLTELELDNSDPNVLMATWKVSESPVGPWVFEKLEKKYSDQETSCSRPDRRLLFERIKYAIMEITQRSINPHPWVKTSLDCGPGPRFSKARFEAELCRLLDDKATREEEKETATMAEAALQSNSQWMDLGMHVDGIGREVGKMVLDELIAESFGNINDY